MGAYIPNIKFYWFKSDNTPAFGYYAGFYGAGLDPIEANLKTVFNSQSEETPIANPVAFGIDGAITVCMGSGLYKIVIWDSADFDNAVATFDNVGADSFGSGFVGTMADLRALLTFNPPYTYMAGYNAKGDGGNGMFWYDATSSQADDGGYCIQPDDLRSEGRWFRIPDENGEVRAASFGYTPQFGGNQTTALIAADAYATSITATLMIPPGSNQGSESSSLTLNAPFVRGVNAKFFSGHPGSYPLIFNGIITEDSSFEFHDYEAGDIQFNPNQENVHPEWFGAVGDGATDDTDAFNVLAAAEPKSMTSGSSGYGLSGTWTIPAGISWNSNKTIITLLDDTIISISSSLELFGITVVHGGFKLKYSGAGRLYERDCIYSGSFNDGWLVQYVCDNYSINPRYAPTHTGGGSTGDKGVYITGAATHRFSFPSMYKDGATDYGFVVDGTGGAGAACIAYFDMPYFSAAFVVDNITAINSAVFYQTVLQDKTGSITIPQNIVALGDITGANVTGTTAVYAGAGGVSSDGPVVSLSYGQFKAGNSSGTLKACGNIANNDASTVISGGGHLDITVLANMLVNNGDKLIYEATGTCSSATSPTFTIAINGGATLFNVVTVDAAAGATSFYLRCIIKKVGANSVQCGGIASVNPGASSTNGKSSTVITPQTFTTASDQVLELTSSAATVTCKTADITLLPAP